MTTNSGLQRDKSAKLLVRERLNWLAVFGAVISLVGSLLMIADNFSVGHAFVNWISPHGEIEKAWERLIQDSVSSRSRLDAGEEGFGELLALITSNQLRYANKNIIAIENGVYEGGIGPEFRAIYLIPKDGERTDIITVATEETVNEWIVRARLIWSLRVGLSWLVIGFLLTFLGHFWRLQVGKWRFKKEHR